MYKSILGSPEVKIMRSPMFGIEILWVSVSESGWLTMGTSQHQLVEDPERALREYVLQRIADRDSD
jgi:hypothetical protein